MIGLIFVLVVVGRRIALMGCIVGAIWMPEQQREWALTFLALALGEVIYQGNRAQALKDDTVVTDQSQTIYSSRGADE